MLLDAMAQLRVEPAQTLFAGDRLRDLEAAQAAGCVPALVGAEPGGQLESEARRRGVAWIATDLAGLAARLAGDAPC
jgi:phosphoglycolate phosphatase-like HAD superfamily hydrolase